MAAQLNSKEREMLDSGEMGKAISTYARRVYSYMVDGKTYADAYDRVHSDVCERFGTTWMTAYRTEGIENLDAMLRASDSTLRCIDGEEAFTGTRPAKPAVRAATTSAKTVTARAVRLPDLPDMPTLALLTYGDNLNRRIQSVTEQIAELKLEFEMLTASQSFAQKVRDAAKTYCKLHELIEDMPDMEAVVKHRVDAALSEYKSLKAEHDAKLRSTYVDDCSVN